MLSTAQVRAAAMALKLITREGETCTWATQESSTIADPTKPFIKANGAVTSSMVAILFKSSGSTALLELLAPTSIEVSGLRAIMGAYPGLAPSISDTVIRSDGTKLALKAIDPVAPGGTPLLYKLTFKQ